MKMDWTVESAWKVKTCGKSIGYVNKFGLSELNILLITYDSPQIEYNINPSAKNQGNCQQL